LPFGVAHRLAEHWNTGDREAKAIRYAMIHYAPIASEWSIQTVQSGSQKLSMDLRITMLQLQLADRNAGFDNVPAPFISAFLICAQR